MPPDAVFFALQQRGAGSRTALFNLLNIALGSGVLGFPAVYAQAGWLYATVFIGVFALIAAFSNTIMVRSASWYRVVSFHSVVREALGCRAGNAVAVAMVVYSFGGCAAFLVIIGDFLSPACMHCRTGMGWHTASDGEIDACSRNFLILAVGVIVVLPLSLRPTITALGRAGALAVLGICYLALAVVWRALQSFADRGYVPPPGLQAVVGTADGLAGPVGTVAWSFAVMLGVPSVFAELNISPGGRKCGKTSYTALQSEVVVSYEHAHVVAMSILDTGDVNDGNCRVQQARNHEEGTRIALMDSVIHWQAAITATFYILVGMGGYLQFGDAAGGGGGSVLNLYGRPTHAQAAGSFDSIGSGVGGTPDLLIDVARVVVSAVVALSFPIIHFTSRLMLYDLCRSWMGRNAVANTQTIGVERVDAPSNMGSGQKQPSERVPLVADDADKLMRDSSGTEIDEQPVQLMTCPVRCFLTLIFWSSCMAFALAGYELGFIFALFGSTCSVSTMLFVPGLLLLDKSGPWRQEGYRQAKLFGWRHEYGGERWRLTIGRGMLLCGGLTCFVSLLLIFEFI